MGEDEPLDDLSAVAMTAAAAAHRHVEMAARKAQEQRAKQLHTAELWAIQAAPGLYRDYNAKVSAAIQSIGDGGAATWKREQDHLILRVAEFWLKITDSERFRQYQRSATSGHAAHNEQVKDKVIQDWQVATQPQLSVELEQAEPTASPHRCEAVEDLNYVQIADGPGLPDRRLVNEYREVTSTEAAKTAAEYDATQRTAVADAGVRARGVPVEATQARTASIQVKGTDADRAEISGSRKKTKPAQTHPAPTTGRSR